jgi:hypothetical protein
MSDKTAYRPSALRGCGRSQGPSKARRKFRPFAICPSSGGSSEAGAGCGPRASLPALSAVIAAADFSAPRLDCFTCHLRLSICRCDPMARPGTRMADIREGAGTRHRPLSGGDRRYPATESDSAIPRRRRTRAFGARMGSTLRNVSKKYVHEYVRSVASFRHCVDRKGLAWTDDGGAR